METADVVVTFILFMMFIATIIEYFFFWDAFQAKHGARFENFRELPLVSRELVMLVYAMCLQLMEVMKVVVFSTALLVIYVYGEFAFNNLIRFLYPYNIFV